MDGAGRKVRRDERVGVGGSGRKGRRDEAMGRRDEGMGWAG